VYNIRKSFSGGLKHHGQGFDFGEALHFEIVDMS